MLHGYLLVGMFSSLYLGRMSLLIVHVCVHIKPGTADAFIAATRVNAHHSRLETGVVRFDLLRDTTDPDCFRLVEIYRDAAAALAHKETPHYLLWRDTVADLMAEPRTSEKFENLDPVDDDAWA
jgi:quinol monooxygenase YgiN